MALPRQTRRELLTQLGQCLALTSLIETPLALLASSEAEQDRKGLSGESLRLRPGDTWNESEAFTDRLSGRPCRRLTTRRRFNQQPTYHLNACFSADSRYLVLATIWPDGSSALLRAEVASGVLTVLGVLPKGSECYDGNNTAIIQANDWVATNTGETLRLHHLHTLEQRVLLNTRPTPPEPRPRRSMGHPSGSIDGRYIYLPLYRRSVVVDGITATPVTHLQLEIATGKVRELFNEKIARCNHVVPCPTDANLILIDRDLPPKYGSGGDDGHTPRAWILRIDNGTLVPVQTRDKNRFQVHSNWNFKGDRVTYHGIAPRGKPFYMGVSDQSGRTVWEHTFPKYHYGHTGSHTRINAIVTDGLVASGVMSAIHWEDVDRKGFPRIETLGAHDTDWQNGQMSHPHPHVAPDGKWLSYNRSREGRSDVCLLQLG